MTSFYGFSSAIDSAFVGIGQVLGGICWIRENLPKSKGLDQKDREQVLKGSDRFPALGAEANCRLCI